nr:unnamed protein product [Callosobruchus chinensis]
MDLPPLRPSQRSIPRKGVCFSRPSLEYGKKYGSASTPQAEGSEARSSEVVIKSFLEFGDRKKDSRKIKLCSFPSPSWTPPLEGDAEGLPSSPRMEAKEGNSGTSACLRGDALVAKTFRGILGRLSSQPGHFHEFGRVRERMGCPNRGQIPKRSVDSGTVAVAHKRKRADGYFPLASAKCGYVDGKDGCSPVGQSDGGFLYQEARGHKISPSYQPGVSPLKLLHGTGYNAYPSVSTRDAQQHRGLFIPGQGIGGLETIRPIGSPYFPKIYIIVENRSRI